MYSFLVVTCVLEFSIHNNDSSKRKLRKHYRFRFPERSFNASVKSLLTIKKNDSKYASKIIITVRLRNAEK